MRKFILIAVVLATIAAGIFGGVPLYRKWMGRQELERAKKSFERNDYKEGLIWLRKVLSRDGNSVEAVRIMADLSETMHSPAAVYWRERLVQLEPAVDSNRIQLARVALASGNIEAAKKALNGLDAKAKNTGEFLRLSGVVAMTEGNLASAEKLFQDSVSLDPNNPYGLLNLGIIRSQRVDPNQSQAGVAILESLRTNGGVRSDALRHLTLDAVRKTNISRAQALVAELISIPPVILNDRLLELEVLKAAKDKSLDLKIGLLQRDTETNARAIMEFGRWMLANGMAHRLLKWKSEIRPEIATNVPVSMVVADGYLALTNWPGLSDWVSKQNWGEYEYLRHAFACRTSKESDKAGSARSQWNEALRATENKLDRLVALQRAMAAWNWLAESEEILWVIVRKYPAERNASLALAELLAARGRTRALMDLMEHESRLQPENLELKNNLAALALLLDANEVKPHEIAKKVYDSAPTNVVYGSTYAYSLYKQNKIKEAFGVLKQYPESQLGQPGVVGYYGLILIANGEQASGKAKIIAALQYRVLPEEEKLFRLHMR